MSISRKTIVVGELRTNCYILFDDEKHALIFDPGDEEKKISDYIIDNGMKVEAIILTHGHFDHIAAADYVSEKFKAPVYVSACDDKLLLNPETNLSLPFIGKKVSLKCERQFFTNEKIDFSFTSFYVIETPGHTKGSVSLYFENEKLLVSGDTIFYHSYGRTDCPTGNHRELYLSITEKILTLPDDTIILPGHGFYTTVKEEKKLWL